MNQNNNKSILNVKSITNLTIIACLFSMTYALAFVAIIIFVMQRKRLRDAEAAFNNRISELEARLAATQANTNKPNTSTAAKAFTPGSEVELEIEIAKKQEQVM